MPQLIKSKIDLAKIHGAKVLKKEGRIFVEVTESQLFEGKNGALYLDFALFPTPQSQFGDDWRITQDMPKALRDAGTRGPILGNGKNKDFGGGSSAPASSRTETTTTMNGGAPSRRPEPAPQHDIDDQNVPF